MPTTPKQRKRDGKKVSASISDCIISAYYPPHIDVTKTPLAYGDRALPRLNRELKDETLLTRQRAVRSLCDYIHDPEHIAEALKIGIVESLKELLKDDDVTVRQKATECFYIFAGHAIGRDAMLTNDIIFPISRLFDDDEDIARQNAHLAIKMVSESPHGAQGVVTAGLVPSLVNKLTDELDEIKELILDTLHFCLRVDTRRALEAHAMRIFTDLLTHPLPQIKAKAARDIMDVSVPLGGKDKAVEEGTIEALIELLSDKNPDVRANAAGALSFITITTDGKYTAIEAGAIKALISLVDDKTSEVRLNVIKVLTCLSEAPEGRKVLLEHVDQIQARTEDHIPAVAKAAGIAVKVVTWIP